MRSAFNYKQNQQAKSHGHGRPMSGYVGNWVWCGCRVVATRHASAAPPLFVSTKPPNQTPATAIFISTQDDGLLPLTTGTLPTRLSGYFAAGFVGIRFPMNYEGYLLGV